MNDAKASKSNEFYTQRTDIEKELSWYRDSGQFKDKVVYCNCDDPQYSHFWGYFVDNFEPFKLKKLIATHYANSGQVVDLFNGYSEPAYALEYDGKKTKKPKLKGDGDFRSAECIEYLKQSDIVVTNPPFSLFREYVKQLMDYEKKFLIIGNMNALTYKEIFPLLSGNKVWIGPSITSGDREFQVPKSYPLDAAGCREDKDGNKFIRVKGVRWYTNLEHKKRNESLILTEEYNPNDYPTYDNYDAIEVRKVKLIPRDYDGVMGVPISFMDKFCPEQFDILGASMLLPEGGSVSTGRFILNGKRMYERMLIQRKKGSEQ